MPYFDDDEDDVRFTRLADGKGEYVPSDMRYGEWKREFVTERAEKPETLNSLETNVEKSLDFSGESGIIKVGSDFVALEYQRYGRNKFTLVNKTYIESGEYKRKFDKATDNPELNKALYGAAKAALKHRSGTELEDMYWFDGNTGRVIASEIDSIDNRQIKYSASTKNAVSSNSNIVTLHSHPSSMPPSIEDFNSCCLNNYKVGYIACHNGKVFGYSSEQIISYKLYELSIGEYLDKGLSEFEAQIRTIEDLKRNHKINFWEVK